MKTKHIILGSLMAVSLAQAQPITVVNPGFELPGGVKTFFFTAGAPNALIPGWTASGAPGEPPGAIGGGDSGVENDATFGLMRGYLAAQDPSIFNTTAYTILGSEGGFNLTLTVRDNYTSDAGYSAIPNSAVLNISLYYLDGASRVPLAPGENRLVNSTFADYSINIFSIPGAAVGKPLGIELDNISDVLDLGGDVVHAWVGLDNIRLEAIPEPTTVALLSLGVAALAISRRQRKDKGV